MIEQQRDFSPIDRNGMAKPNDMLQTASAVIATTRHAWAARGAADEPVPDRGRLADPLFRLALDAISSSAGRG